MEHNNLKRILSCYSIAGLLTTGALTGGCSQQENAAGKPEDQQASQQQNAVEDRDSDKSNKPDGTEVQIRGKSG